jgi:rhamnosyltransferase subunit B
MANVLLLTWGTGGDIRPMARIGSGLKARGHEVTLITSDAYADVARQAGLQFAGLESAEETRAFLQEVNRLESPIEFARHYRQRLLPRMPLEYAVIEQHYRPGDTILVSHIVKSATGHLSAEKLKIPFVLFYGAPINIELRFGRFAVTKSFIERNDSFSAEIRAALDLPYPWGGGPVCRLGHWPAWFAPLGPEVPFAVTPIGFIFDHSNDPLPPAVQTFLAAGPPPILITHGTSLPKDPAFFSASAAACQRLGERGLLVTSRAELVPDPLPEGVAHFPYVPYGSLLPYLRAMIHHGGLGTVGAAMEAGIPQLLLPAGYDRRDNASNVKRLGVGDFVRPHQWRPEIIAQALAPLLSSPDVQLACRQLAAAMREGDPVATACDWIESVLARRSTAALRAVSAGRRQAAEAVILESRLEAPLRQQFGRLSPEKRALLAARLRRQARARSTAAGTNGERGRAAALRQQLRQLSPEKQALLAARLRRQT